jgi:hypothetical protein
LWHQHDRRIRVHGEAERRSFFRDIQLKDDGELWHFSRLRQCKFASSIAEQDHGRLKYMLRLGAESAVSMRHDEY